MEYLNIMRLWLVLLIGFPSVALSCGDSQYESQSDFANLPGDRLVKRDTGDERKACNLGDEQPLTR